MRIQKETQHTYTMSPVYLSKNIYLTLLSNFKAYSLICKVIFPE